MLHSACPSVAGEGKRRRWCLRVCSLWTVNYHLCLTHVAYQATPGHREMPALHCITLDVAFKIDALTTAPPRPRPSLPLLKSASWGRVGMINCVGAMSASRPIHSRERERRTKAQVRPGRWGYLHLEWGSECDCLVAVGGADVCVSVCFCVCCLPGVTFMFVLGAIETAPCVSVSVFRHLL